MIDISSSIIDDCRIIHIKGEIDASSSIHLDKAIESALTSHDKIVVDLSSLTYISSAGLGVFMSYLQELQQQNKRWVFYGMSSKILHVFQLLGIDQFLTIVSSQDEAMIKIHE